MKAPTVKRLLRTRGLTVSAAARLIGVSQSVLSRVIRKKAASKRVREALDRLLGVVP